MVRINDYGQLNLFARQIARRRIISARLIHQFKTALAKGCYDVAFRRSKGGGANVWTAELKVGKSYSTKLPIKLLECVIDRNNELQVKLYVFKKENKSAGILPMDQLGGVDWEGLEELVHIVEVNVSRRVVKIDNTREKVLSPVEGKSFFQSLEILVDLLKEKSRPEEKAEQEEEKRNYLWMRAGRSLWFGINPDKWKRLEAEGKLTYGGNRETIKDYFSPKEVTINTFLETFELHLKHYFDIPEDDRGAPRTFAVEFVRPVVEDLESSRFSKVKEKNSLRDIIEFVERLDGEFVKRPNPREGFSPRQAFLKRLLFYVSYRLNLEYSPINGFRPARFAELFRNFEVKLGIDYYGESWHFDIYERTRGADLAGLSVEDNELTLWPNPFELGRNGNENSTIQEIEKIISEGIGFNSSMVKHTYKDGYQEFSHYKWVAPTALI